MADGFFALGDLLGGGVDTTTPYNEGLYEGSRAQKALAEARVKRDEAVSRVRLEESLRAAGIKDPNVLATVMRGGFGNFEQATAGLGNLQEQDFRATAADPTVPIGDANRALMGVANGPVDRFQTVGPGLFADRFSDAAPVVSPVGEAAIAADAALAADRNAQAGTRQPLADALIDQRGASAASSRSSALLNNEKRLHPERFRASPVSLSLFGPNQDQPLGDFLVDASPAQPTLPDNLTREGMEGGTGLEGLVRRTANIGADILEQDLPFPKVDVAQNAMEDLAIRLQTVGQTAIPGRPSNYLMQLLDKRNVNPADILKGDARALNRFRQTRNTIAADVERLHNMLNNPAGLSKADLSDTRIAFDVMRGLQADFDKVLGVLEAPEAIDLGDGFSAESAD